MASSRLEGRWAPHQQTTTIHTRRAPPKPLPADADRPAASTTTRTALVAVPDSPRVAHEPAPPARKDVDTQTSNSPRAPEIVDVASLHARGGSRRGLPHPRAPAGPTTTTTKLVPPSPSMQSEKSFGILDYYMRKPSPLQIVHGPITTSTPAVGATQQKLPTPTTLDPAIDKFDFGLKLPSTPTSEAPPPPPKDAKYERAAKAGAQQPRRAGRTDSAPPLPPPLPPPPSGPSRAQHNRSYSLFPSNSLQNAKLYPAASDLKHITAHPGQYSSNAPPAIPLHPAPDPSYRPRKESLSSSIRSRKDSVLSSRGGASVGSGSGGGKRIRMRMLSCSTNDSLVSSSSAGSASVSPEQQPQWHRPRHHGGRWSDETITSPRGAAAMTLGSVAMGENGAAERDMGGYPACFFEDDDESEFGGGERMPLRRKLGWSRGDDGATTGEEDARGWGWRVWGRVFCGLC